MPHLLALTLLCLLFPALASAAGNEQIESWTDVRRIFNNIYHDHQETLYCGFPYDSNRRTVFLPEGFIITSHHDRAFGMEREHAVPVENFGRAFREYRDGSPYCVHADGTPYRGRECAAKASRRFRLMLCDLHNIFPSVGSVNAMRGHRELEPLPDSADIPFGQTCPMKFSGRSAEPPDRAKGIVARAYKYMDWAYPEYRMSDKRRRTMEIWDNQFPPDAWECERNRRIRQVQGNGNPFVEAKCDNKMAIPDNQKVLSDNKNVFFGNKEI